MRLLPCLAVLLSLAQPPGAAFGGDHATCIKANCEGKGQSCLSAAFVVQQACMRSARQTCDKVLASEKFSCLKGGLSPCASAGNTADADCLSLIKSCYAACGPANGKSTNFWCTAETDGTLKSGFCFGAPGKDVFEQSAPCAKQLLSEVAGLVNLSCETL